LNFSNMQGRDGWPDLMVPVQYLTFAARPGRMIAVRRTRPAA